MVGDSRVGYNVRMKISVSVKPNAKREEVQKVDETHFIVRVHAPAREGRANKRVEELLAGYFDIPKMSVWLISGRTSKEKVFGIKQ